MTDLCYFRKHLISLFLLFLCCSESCTLVLVLCLNITLVDECVIRPFVPFSVGLLLIVNSLEHS